MLVILLEKFLSDDSAIFVDNDSVNVENVENLKTIEKLNLEIARKKISKKPMEADVATNTEAGFCMRKYRNKVLAWFEHRNHQVSIITYQKVTGLVKTDCCIF